MQFVCLILLNIFIIFASSAEAQNVGMPIGVLVHKSVADDLGK